MALQLTNQKIPLIPMDTAFLSGIKSPAEILRWAQDIQAQLASLPHDQTLSLNDIREMGIFDLAHQYFTTFHSPYLSQELSLGKDIDFPWTTRNEIAITFINAASRQDENTDLLSELISFCKKSYNKGYCPGLKHNHIDLQVKSKKPRRSDPLDNYERCSLFGKDLKQAAFKLAFVDGQDLRITYPYFFSKKSNFIKGEIPLSFHTLIKLPSFTPEKMQNESSPVILYGLITNSAKSNPSLADFYPFKDKTAAFISTYQNNIFRPLFQHWADEIFTDFITGNFAEGNAKALFLQEISGHKYKKYISENYAKSFLQKYLSQNNHAIKLSSPKEIDEHFQHMPDLIQRTPAATHYLSALTALKQSHNPQATTASLTSDKVNSR